MPSIQVSHMQADMQNSVPSIQSLVENQDTFDSSAGPIIYMSENRSPVIIDSQNTLIYLIFGSLLLMVLFLLPGLRRTKFATLISLLAIMITGLTILIGLNGSCWLRGQIYVKDLQYSTSHKPKVESFTGLIDISIGLSWTNVTLNGYVSEIEASVENTNDQLRKHVLFNERFNWDQPERMASEHKLALQKGLPYPLLTVSEFFAQDSDGFNWSRQLRSAGYYSSLCLYIALASWITSIIIMCALPKYLTQIIQVTSGFILMSIWVYTILIGSSPLGFNGLRLGGSLVEFRFGFNYLMCFVAGIMGMLASIVLLLIQFNKPHNKLTALDSDEYVHDQKTIYLTKNNNHLSTAKQDAIEKQTQQQVIIPIADIEQQFNNMVSRS